MSTYEYRVSYLLENRVGHWHGRDDSGVDKAREIAEAYSKVPAFVDVKIQRREIGQWEEVKDPS